MLQVVQVGVGGGGSTTSSSTEDSETRERRFGSIDLQQSLPLKTSTGTAGIGADLAKGQSPIDAQLKQALLAEFSEFKHSSYSSGINSRFIPLVAMIFRIIFYSCWSTESILSQIYKAVCIII